MIYRNDLKIEFKAEPYGLGGNYHVLIYRISPDQDLTYYEYQSFLGLNLNVKEHLIHHGMKHINI